MYMYAYCSLLHYFTNFMKIISLIPYSYYLHYNELSDTKLPTVDAHLLGICLCVYIYIVFL